MLKKGLQVFRGSIRFFKCYPICIVPLLLTWCVYAGVTLYFYYEFDFSRYTVGAEFAILFGVYVLFAFLFGLSCLILLEFIQQLEQGQKPSLFRAVMDSVIRDFWKAIPVLLVWAVIWFFLAILGALLSGGKDREDSELTAKNAVGTLLGANRKFSLSRAFLSALSKGVRMLAFLILPAIAWEDLPPIPAIKKGLATVRDGKGQFLIAYGLTELFAIVALLIPGVLYTLDDKLSLNLPPLFWCVVLIYMAFATSLIFLVEQLYTAQLYQWHLNWEKSTAGRRGTGKGVPSLSAADQPEFFRRFCHVDMRKNGRSSR